TRRSADLGCLSWLEPQGKAGVVHENVDRGKLRREFLHAAVDVVLVLNVEARDVNSLAEFVTELLEAILAPARRNDPGAGSSETSGCCRPEARGGAGNEKRKLCWFERCDHAFWPPVPCGRSFAWSFACCQDSSSCSRRPWSRLCPSAANFFSIAWKRLSNLRLARRSAASGSTARWRARLTTENSRSPSSSSSRSGWPPFISAFNSSSSS